MTNPANQPSDQTQPPAQSTNPSALSPEAATSIKAYAAYSRWLNQAGGVVQVAAGSTFTFLANHNKRDQANAAYQAMTALHNVLSGMNDAFIKAIDDVTAGRSFEPLDVPTKLPPMPAAPPAAGRGSAAGMIAEGLWSTLRPVIEQVVAKQSQSNLAIALTGLLQSGEDAVQQIVKIVAGTGH